MPDKKTMKTILLVDDESAWLKTMKAILQSKSIKVVTAETGEDALSQLSQKKKPDLILCDVRMPVMNGYDFFLKAKELPKIGKVPFVFMSNFDDFDARNVAKRLGADDYVTKPLSIEEANTLVTELLTRFSKKTLSLSNSK